MANQTTKPPFSYFGGKMSMTKHVLSLLGPHRVYLEPFLGSGAVLFAKEPATHELVNDIDGDVVAFMSALRDHPDELEEVCRLTPYARDEQAAAKAAYSDDPIEQARLFWVRVNQSFNKNAERNNGFSSSTATGASPANTVSRRIDRFRACADRLAHVVIENRDAFDFIQQYDAPDVAMYIDCPYSGAVRNTKAGYTHDALGDGWHRDLATLLDTARGLVVVSGYAGTLYEELYEGWHRTDIEMLRRTTNSKATARKVVTECLWTNQTPSAHA